MKNLEDLIFINPETKKEIYFDKNKNRFRDQDIFFNKFDKIHDLFLDDKNKITNDQSEFYNDVKFPNYDDIDDFGSLIDKASKSLFAKKLDDELNYNSKILEAGCGTGQLSIFLSRYNRQVFGIDLSKGSLLEAENFLNKNNIKNVYLFRMNIFKLLFEDNYFDYIISNGVLHHTHNPKLAFSMLTKKLKKHGYIIIGLYHKYGRFVQKLRQNLIKIFGPKLRILDRRFSENISQKKKYAWFLDQYKNPSETVHTLEEVLNWFKENNISYISSIPFDFDNEKPLLDESNIKLPKNLFLKEISLTFNLRQIYEGGFFIVIGKKN